MSEEYQKEFIGFKNELSAFIFRLLANKQDTEDVVQDTYIKVFEKLNTFQGKSSFKTWVFTIALNSAKNHLSKQKMWKENAQDLGADVHANSAELIAKMRSVFEKTSALDYEVEEHINYWQLLL